MNEDDDRSEPADQPLSVGASVETRTGVPDLESASSFTASEIQGDQQFAYADIRIRVETAAHQRVIETRRLEHDLESDRLEREEKRTSPVGLPAPSSDT